MSKTLSEIAQQLSTPRKTKKTVTKEVEEIKSVPKVQLIYAFNGTGKTRLSRDFKQLIAPKVNGGEGDGEAEQSELSRKKILYYNAFTEDLFYWDNDLQEDAEPKLKVQPNSYTNWLLTLLKDLGQDGNIVRYFQHYSNDKLTPHFSTDFTEVTFSME
ncbi:TPA: anticodon nuclease, partial [Enterobacter kobei]|nr:anticodon nuclease [Enterobacter kobei]